jgi:hypothetical protein
MNQLRNQQWGARLNVPHENLPFAVPDRKVIEVEVTREFDEPNVTFGDGVLLQHIHFPLVCCSPWHFVQWLPQHDLIVHALGQDEVIEPACAVHIVAVHQSVEDRKLDMLGGKLGRRVGPRERTSSSPSRTRS